MGNVAAKPIDMTESINKLEAKYKIALQQNNDEVTKFVQDAVAKSAEGLAEVKTIIEQNNKLLTEMIEKLQASFEQGNNDLKALIQQQNELLQAKLSEKHESIKIMIETLKPKPRPPKARGFYDEPDVSE